MSGWDEGAVHYRKGIYRESLIQNPKFLLVNLSDLLTYDKEQDLRGLLRKNPSDYLPLFETAAAEVNANLKSRVTGDSGEMEEPETGEVQVLLKSDEDSVSMRSLGVEFNEFEESSMLITTIAWDESLSWTFGKAVHALEATMRQVSYSIVKLRKEVPNTSILSSNNVPSKKVWDFGVNRALQMINENNSLLIKVVLARSSIIKTSSDIDPLTWLATLQVEGENSYQFCVQPPDAPSFIENTPEHLFHRNRLNIYSEAMAGTRARGDSKPLDLQIALDLLSSSKDDKEFSIVRECIRRKLEAVCTTILVEPEKTIRKLTRVQHLYARLRGRLKSEDDEVGETACPIDPWIVVPDRSKYVDQQTLKLQENPEDVPTGELPRNMLLSVDRHFVQTIVPGTRLAIMGIYNIFQVAKSPHRAVAVRQPYIRVGIEETNEATLGPVNFTTEEVIFTNEANIEPWKNKRQVAVDSKIGRLDSFIKLVKIPMQVFIACGVNKGKEEDPFRKPQPGMWRIMEQQFNSGIPVDMDQSFYVGDAAGRKDDHSDADKKSKSHIVAPCPHDEACPLDNTGKYCHFVQRLQRTTTQLAYKVLFFGHKM